MFDLIIVFVLILVTAIAVLEVLVDVLQAIQQGPVLRPVSGPESVVDLTDQLIYRICAYTIAVDRRVPVE